MAYVKRDLSCMQAEDIIRAGYSDYIVSCNTSLTIDDSVQLRKNLGFPITSASPSKDKAYDYAFLDQLLYEGYTNKQITLQSEICHETIRRRRRKLGLPAPSNIDYEKMRSMLFDNIDIHIICEEIQCSKVSVYHEKKRLGFSKEFPNEPFDRVASNYEILDELLEYGFTTVEIYNEFLYSYQEIIKRRTYLKNNRINGVGVSTSLVQ